MLQVMAKTLLNSMIVGKMEAAVSEDIFENALQSTKEGKQVLQTDVGNGYIFAQLYGDDIRYSCELSKWLVWDGKRWVLDNTKEIYNKAKKATNRLWRAVDKFSDSDRRDSWKKHAKRSESAYRIKAMVELAQSEPGIAIPQTKLDGDPWLLNVENGTLDLKTGLLRTHSRKDLITKIAPVIYDEKAVCPSWDKFLNEIMAGDPDLIRFLQKVIGYSLTGDTREQVLFVLFGTGANGKSTFINAILSLLGDYAQQTPTETLLAKKHGNGIPNDVARLKGARLVAAVEAEQGRPLAEALVKQLTGGDKITARYLYGEYFEFCPTFKLFLSVNHRPVIKSSDYGIWRRVRLIPFNVTFLPEKRDPALSTKLEAELPGILRWAVEGCLLWQKQGLEPPDAVKAATETYRSDMDDIGEFIAECCVVDAAAKTPFADLFTAYDNWLSTNGVHFADKKEFAQALQSHGFTSSRSNGTRYRLGIRLKQGDG
jgi:putative DNA primase/helicase